MTVEYVLRDLPGVADLEATLDRVQAHPNPLWAPENDGVPAAAEALVKRLFGVSFDEAEFEPCLARGPLQANEPVWERRIWLIEDEDRQITDEEELENWLKIGWDVRHSDGRCLLSLAFFDYFIVGAKAGQFGRLPNSPRTEREIARSTSEFEARLAADAANFQHKKDRPR